MNDKLRKATIITGVCLGMLTGTTNIYAEEYPSEWDAESEGRTYITDEEGNKYYVTDEFAAEWNAETATKEETTGGQETTQETPETGQNSTEEEQVTNDELQAVKEELQAINNKLNAPILRSPANVNQYFGLKDELPIYIYRVWCTSLNRWLYVGSNSLTLAPDTNPDSDIYLWFSGVYTDENKQQALVFFYDEKQAESTKWGTANFSSTNAEAARYLGAVFDNKKPFIQPYEYVVPIRRWKEEEDAANGEFWPAYYRVVYVRDNGAYLGTQDVSLDLTTWELVRTKQKQPFTTEDLYVIGGTIIALLTIIIFKRGKH